MFLCQAEDGIRDRNVTGVQTCALPIWDKENRMPAFAAAGATASSPSESMKRAKPVGEIPKGSEEGLPAMVVERSTSAAEASRAVRRSSIGNLNCMKGRSSLT